MVCRPPPSHRGKKEGKREGEGATVLAKKFFLIENSNYLLSNRSKCLILIKYYKLIEFKKLNNLDLFIADN